jgi:hypothetical protein
MFVVSVPCTPVRAAIRPVFLTFLAALTLAGCASERESNPVRTATEQLLISNAADRAAEKLHFGIPAGTKVFLDATNFEGTDGKYAVAAIRERLLREGASLVAERAGADAVVEIRAGALSIDKDEFLIGIPEFDVPIPLAGELTVPEFALYKRETRRGVAKFAGVGYGKDGRLIGTTAAQYGFAHKVNRTAFFVISWTNTDAIPPTTEPREDAVAPGEAESAPAR